MIDERDVREMLQRRANAVSTSDVDAPRATQRARRRLLANGAVAVLATVAIAAGTVAGVGAIRSAPLPGDTPAPSLSLDVLRSNGEVLRVTGTPGDLVAVNPQTGEERVLVEGLGAVYSARWSADGRWVAYETPGPDGIELWVVDASGQPRRVATGASILAWSPSGAELATIRMTAPLHEDIAGSTLTTIDPVTGAASEVGAVPADVGDVTSPPAWSPDRTRFAFGARGGAIYSIDVASGATSLLAQLTGERFDSVDQVVWSPDGAHIAVLQDGEAGGMYVLNADGSNVRLVFGDRTGAGFAWSPDGTRLAYMDGSGVIWVAPMDGSAPTRVGAPLSRSCDALFCGESLTWSPDGSTIAYRIAGGGSVEASAIDADGLSEAEPVDELTVASWAGGAYSCECR